jgi:excisionase family DNA binding protein
MDLMTTAEVASYLRLKERALYELATKRQIPCTRATGKLLFPRHLVDRWLEAHTDLSQTRVTPPPPIYAGSSDPLLEWALRESGGEFAVLASGSQDGLRRLAGGKALLAGSHLLDPESGVYNIPAIRRELPFPDVVAIRWATRRQGLLVAAGNPLDLRDIADIVAKKARLALRPPDSGSRLLFDTLAGRAGLDLVKFTTCDREPRTELDLATMIADDGDADCGIGIEAVATRHGLGFVPLGVQEDFDLVMRRRDYFEAAVQKLMAFARTETFRRRTEALGGYDTTRLGEVTFNG